MQIGAIGRPLRGPRHEQASKKERPTSVRHALPLDAQKRCLEGLRRDRTSPLSGDRKTVQRIEQWINPLLGAGSCARFEGEQSNSLPRVRQSAKSWIYHDREAGP